MSDPKHPEVEVALDGIDGNLLATTMKWVNIV